MKKKLIFLTCILLIVFFAVGCSQGISVKETIEGNLKTYYEMSDGTWKCGKNFYQHCFKISGRMPNASADSIFVYLSNLEEISFEQAWRAAGLSSSSDDYFSPKEAVLVDWRQK